MLCSESSRSFCKCTSTSRTKTACVATVVSGQGRPTGPKSALYRTYYAAPSMAGAGRDKLRQGMTAMGFGGAFLRVCVSTVSDGQARPGPWLASAYGVVILYVHTVVSSGRAHWAVCLPISNRHSRQWPVSLFSYPAGTFHVGYLTEWSGPYKATTVEGFQGTH